MKPHLIELSNNSGLKVIFSSLGASIVEIYLDGVLLTMSPIDIDDLNREDIYYGKTIGPIANRVKDGLVVINNKSYFLPLNEKGVSNHSGSDGLSNKIFDYQIKDKQVIFEYRYKGVLPGKALYRIIYTLDGCSLRIDLEAIPKEDTVIALTNHTFFNLGEACIDNLSLAIPADEYIEADPNNLVPLQKKPINDCLDFNKEKTLRDSYDHCYFLREKKAYLKSDKYKLEIETDYACLQIYTDNFVDNVKVKNTSSFTRRGIAIEPEDSLLDRSLIKNGEQYHRFIVYKFLKLYS